MQSMRGRLRGGNTLWLEANVSYGSSTLGDGCQPGLFLGLLNSAFFPVQVTPSLGRVGGGRSSRGSCVCVDLKLIKPVSSSSSVGRPSGLPPGCSSWRTLAPFSFRIHYHCKKKPKKTVVCFQEATQSWSLHQGGDSWEHKQSASQQPSVYNF